MMRKFAVALIATTVLAAPALAADPARPSPDAKSSPTTTTAPSGADAAGKADSAGKAGATSQTGVAGSKADKGSGTAGAADVKTIKPDQELKNLKADTRTHPHHSKHWYMVHGGHSHHVMAAAVSNPAKGAGAQKGKDTHEVKTNKTTPSKSGSSS
jgi:hypothetical protein